MISKFLKEVENAKKELKKYSNKQVKFVEKAYQDCLDNMEHWSQVKRDWAVEAAEDELFDDDNDFFKVFELVDKIREVDAVSNS